MAHWIYMSPVYRRHADTLAGIITDKIWGKSTGDWQPGERCKVLQWTVNPSFTPVPVY